MSSFYQTFIETMVDIGIARERAQYLSELLRSEIVARHAEVAQAAAARREAAELKRRNLQTPELEKR